MRRVPAGRRVFLISLLLIFSAVAVAARADVRPVDLVLVLAADVSDSIDSAEVKLQREGYISAMKHPQTLQAIKGGKHGRIAVAYFEWSDGGNQTLIVDWMTIQDETSGVQFGELLKPAKIPEGHFTSISSAIQYGLSMLKRSPYQSKSRVIDISGDGQNNSGPPLEPVRAEAKAQGVVINGLPIVNDRGRHYSGLPPVKIQDYYRRNVIVGDSAFIITAKNFLDFERAIRRKLIREIADAGNPRSIAETGLSDPLPPVTYAEQAVVDATDTAH